MRLKFMFALAAAALLPALPVLASEINPPATAEASASPVAGKTYTCTMHPEIVKVKPGDCPKCGMKLVPKVESGQSK